MQVTTIKETWSAGETKRFYMPFSFLQVVSANSDITVRIVKHNGQAESAADVPQSFKWKSKAGEQAQGVEIYSAGAQTVHIILTDGEAETMTLGGSIMAESVASDTMTTPADVTTGAAAEIVAANASRKAVTIQALSTNTAVVRVGDSNVGASRGLELQAGQSVTIETTAAIYAYSAAAQKLAVMEV